MTKNEFMHKVNAATIQALQFIQDTYANKQETPEQLQKQLDEKLEQLETFQSAPMSPEAVSDPDNLERFRVKKGELNAEIAQLSLKIKNVVAAGVPVTIKTFGVENETNVFIFILSDETIHRIPTYENTGDLPKCAEDTLFAAAEYISEVIARYNCECSTDSFQDAELSPLSSIFGFSI